MDADLAPFPLPPPRRGDLFLAHLPLCSSPHDRPRPRHARPGACSRRGGDASAAPPLDGGEGTGDWRCVLRRLSPVWSLDAEERVQGCSILPVKGLTCLMQISTRTEDFIIDTLKLRIIIGPYLTEHFKDPTKRKIMHGADRDIMWLQRDFRLYVCNLFDTGQVQECSNEICLQLYEKEQLTDQSYLHIYGMQEHESEAIAEQLKKVQLGQETYGALVANPIPVMQTPVMQTGYFGGYSNEQAQSDVESSAYYYTQFPEYSSSGGWSPQELQGIPTSGGHQPSINQSRTGTGEAAARNNAGGFQDWRKQQSSPFPGQPK
ncbi:uncharacterized protein [Lolium perenne]|uniref:uncharacterized protein n=1 Tax=Lolium perenne TaxID=4522 RepID=UPI0021F571EC|nr:uncharacterized protein LOC127305983 [Lolium perenne]